MLYTSLKRLDARYTTGQSSLHPDDPCHGICLLDEECQGICLLDAVRVLQTQSVKANGIQTRHTMVHHT